MKLPTVTLVLLSIFSVARSTPLLFGRKPTAAAPNQGLQAANNALKPSLFQKTKALVTGKPAEQKQAADIKKTNTTVVMNQDKKMFSVDKNKALGSGEHGSVYEAKSHSDPHSPTVMKESITKGSFDPTAMTKNQGESSKDHKTRLQTAQKGAAKNDQAQAQAKINKENGFNEKMGLSAGKPVAVSNGTLTKTYLPMKKVEGTPLLKEIIKPKTDPTYISSHTLVNNAKNAINDTNRNGIVHNDTHAGNIMVTNTGGKVIDYGFAKDMASEPNKLKDHTILYGSLNRGRKYVPLNRLDSFDHAVGTYKDQISHAMVNNNTVV